VQHAPMRQQILTIALTAFNQYVNTKLVQIAANEKLLAPSLAELLDILLFGIARRAP